MRHAGDSTQNRGPIFGDLVTGRGNGRRRWAMDCLGNTYATLPNGREKRGGRKTKTK
jgi:hypothetical protein